MSSGGPDLGLRTSKFPLREKRRPKTIWLRTVMKELKELGLTWFEAQAKARDRLE